MDLVMIMTFT